MPKENSFSKKIGSLDYTPFLCQEMLFDYITGQLDVRRMKAVEEKIENDPEVKRAYETLKNGADYCALLGKIKVQEDLIAEVSDTSGIWNRFAQMYRFQNWPAPVRWGVEAFLVSGFAAGAVLLVFWPNFKSWIPIDKSPILLHEEAKVRLMPANLDLNDEGKLAEIKDLFTSVPASAKKLIKDSLADRSDTKKTKDKKIELAKSDQLPAGSDEIGDDIEEAKDESISEAKKEKTDAKVFTSYVFKAYMNLENLEENAPKIIKKIESLGGEKAGQVELGWKKPRGRYFHFTMAISNRKELADWLATLGPVTILKEPHPRTIKGGRERYILWVEEKK